MEYVHRQELYDEREGNFFLYMKHQLASLGCTVCPWAEGVLEGRSKSDPRSTTGRPSSSSTYRTLSRNVSSTLPPGNATLNKSFKQVALGKSTYQAQCGRGLLVLLV